MYRYSSVSYITSTAPGGQAYECELPEIAVAGRSNVGKSSFINMIADNRKLAKTGSTPGRTRMVNYFRFGDLFLLVDLPGYGYAEVRKEDKEKWGQLIEGYLLNAKRLRRIILLLDCRHMPTVQDVQMVNFMYHYALPFTAVLTKTDKLTRAQLQKNTRDIARALRLTENDVFTVSAETRAGREEMIAFLNELAAREDLPDGED